MSSSDTESTSSRCHTDHLPPTTPTTPFLDDRFLPVPPSSPVISEYRKPLTRRIKVAIKTSTPPPSDVEEYEEAVTKALYVAIPVVESPGPRPQGLMPRSVSIEFGFVGEPWGRGLPLTRLYADPIGSVQRMCLPTESVFQPFGLRKARILCLWPGIPGLCVQWEFAVYNESKEPVVRLQVAYSILQAYLNMLRMHTSTREVSPALVGSGQPTDLMSLERLWLVALRHVADNRFKAEVHWRP